MLEKIQDYEKRLIEDRKRLLELTRESGESPPELLQSRLEYFETELLYMNRQLEWIKKQQMQKNQAAIPQGDFQQVPPVMNQQLQSAYQQVPPVINQQLQSAYQQVPPVMNQQSQSAYQQVPPVLQGNVQKAAGKKDMEKVVGKSLMGIFASVLIFISLILFSTLVLQQLGDMAKLVMIYAVSLGFVVVGLYKLQKDKGNHFYLAVTGCGAGAVYISLFLTNVYFQMIGDITLYLLLALWAVGNCVLSKYHSRIFQVIGQCGVTVAVIFGCILCVSAEDVARFAVLTVFYIVASNLFYFTSFERELSKNYVHHVFHIIDNIVLCIGCDEVIDSLEQPHLLTLAFILMLVFHIGVVFWNRWKKESAGYGMILTFYMILLAFFITQLISSDSIQGALVYIAAMIVSIVAEMKLVVIKAKEAGMAEAQLQGVFYPQRKPKESYGGKNILQIAMMIVGTLGLQGIMMPDYLFLLFMAAPLTVLGFVYHNQVYKYGALVLQLYYILLSSTTGEGMSIVCQLMIFVLVYVLMLQKREQYTMSYKIWLYFIVQFFVAREFAQFLTSIFASRELVAVIVYGILLAYNLIMRNCLAHNRKTGESENIGVYNIVNLFLMLLGMSYIISFENEILHLLVIMATLAAFLVNVKNLMQSHKSMLAGIYVGIKFTILMVVILSSFDAVNYVVSICCFLFAIVSVSSGFLLKYKSLRIYGIVLSMISIFKLLMLDINYENTLGNAVSFFVSGMLCFAISMIYNYMDKKLMGDSDMQE